MFCTGKQNISDSQNEIQRKIIQKWGLRTDSPHLLIYCYPMIYSSQVSQQSILCAMHHTDLAATPLVWGCCWARTLLFLSHSQCQHHKPAAPFNNSKCRADNVQHGCQGWQRTPDRSACTPTLSWLLFLWLCELEGGLRADEQQASYKGQHLQKSFENNIVA